MECSEANVERSRRELMRARGMPGPFTNLIEPGDHSEKRGCVSLLVVDSDCFKSIVRVGRWAPKTMQLNS